MVEGTPPALDAPAVFGFAYLTFIATAVAYAAWFTGLRYLSAGTVGLIGLLNPVTGVLLGTALGGETFGPPQLLGTILVLSGILLGQPSAARFQATRHRASISVTTRTDAMGSIPIAVTAPPLTGSTNRAARSSRSTSACATAKDHPPQH